LVVDFFVFFSEAVSEGRVFERGEIKERGESKAEKAAERERNTAMILIRRSQGVPSETGGGSVAS